MSAGKVDVLAVMLDTERHLSSDFMPLLAQQVGEARAAVAELMKAARAVMAKHDAEAVSCNFSYCGCDYCAALRSGLARIGGAP